METSSKNLWEQFKYKFFNDHQYSSRRKIYNTLWAIIFGFIISGIIISFTGNNPFLVFGSIFYQGSTTFGNKLVSVFVSYLFASLAVAICFKAGLFNIGISGQMMSSGFITLVIFRSYLINHSQIDGGVFCLAMFSSIIIGSFIALLAGLLKTCFGINEVVSTIMINWVLFFLIKFFIYQYQSLDGQDFLATSDSISSNLSSGYELSNFFLPNNLDNSWYANNWNWILITIGLIVVIAIWFLLSRTAFGYKVKMVGLNKDASEYSGTNQNSLTLIVMSISGGFAGFAGFVWYINQGGQLDVADQPLLAGFDAIAISLLVFNNPIGIIFSSYLYGIFNVGANGLSAEFVGLQKEISQVIVGVFIYCAAITVIFNKFNVYRWTKEFLILSRFDKYQIESVKLWKARSKYIFSWFGTKKELFVLNKNHKKVWRDIKNQHNKKIIELENWYCEKHNLNKFDVSTLNESEQNSYFDKNAIKAKRIIKYQNHKKHFYEIKNELLQDYYEIKSEKRKIKLKEVE